MAIIVEESFDLPATAASLVEPLKSREATVELLKEFEGDAVETCRGVAVNGTLKLAGFSAGLETLRYLSTLPRFIADGQYKMLSRLAEGLPPCLVEALDFAALGWKVLPVAPAGKTPLVRWQEEATDDEATIRLWWSKWPNANLAALLGKTQGVIDVESDCKEGNKLALSQVRGQHKLSISLAPLTYTYPNANVAIVMGPHYSTRHEDWIVDIDADCDEGIQFVTDLFRGYELNTWRFRGKKGEHFVFRYSGQLPNHDKANWKIKGRNGQDIADMKVGNGKGSYVVAPPSIHPDGPTYTDIPGFSLDDFSPMPWPEEVLGRFHAYVSEGSLFAGVEGRRAKPPEHWLDLKLNGAPEGARNETLAHYAGKLLRGVPLDRSDLVDAVRKDAHAWFMRQTVPGEDPKGVVEKRRAELEKRATIRKNQPPESGGGGQ